MNLDISKITLQDLRTCYGPTTPVQMSTGTQKPLEDVQECEFQALFKIYDTLKKEWIYTF